MLDIHQMHQPTPGDQEPAPVVYGSEDDLNSHLYNALWANRPSNTSSTNTYSPDTIGASVDGLLNMRNTDTEE